MNTELKVTLTPEQDQYLQLCQTRAYYMGVREGIERFAHWSNGEQYVGTTGRTLKSALEKVDQELEQVLERANKLLRI
jgi:hypothetical protein